MAVLAYSIQLINYREEKEIKVAFGQGAKEKYNREKANAGFKAYS